MGRQKLGDFFRKTDYLKVKADYKNSSDDPNNQLSDFEYKCQDSMTFDEFKDAFAAFEEKICIPGFPERYSPAYYVAYNTIEVLQRMAEKLVSDQEQLSSSISKILLHALVALMKAGPGSTHTELMDQIRDKTEPEVGEYAKTLRQNDLVPLMTAAKITFRYPPNDYCEETHYASYQGDQLQAFFLMFTEKQLKSVHKEFLDTHIHYQRQLPKLSEEYGKQIVFLVKGMVENFEDENPYLGLKDKEVIKQHLSVIQSMVLSESYTNANPTDNAAEFTLSNIVKAVMKDRYLEDVCDDLMSTIKELHKHENFRREGQCIYDVYAYTLFEELKNKKTAPGPKLVQSCVKLVTAIQSQGEVTYEAEKLLDYALDYITQTAKSVSSEDVTLSLSMVDTMLGLGRQRLVVQAEQTLENLKKIKALDWKKHTDKAKHILSTIAKIPTERMQDDEGSSLDNTLAAYHSFMKYFREQLKSGKVVPELQASFVDFYFTCLVISSPVKAVMADEMLARGYIIFSKDKQVRLRVLEQSKEILKNEDLPWEDSYLCGAVAKVLRMVVDSYDGNGKKVTEEENKLFMSIFKIVMEGGESVEEHFYIGEDGDTMNYRMKVWQNVLRSYTQLHKETPKTVSYIVPVIPEVLRWTKIALAEEHKHVTRQCFDILNWVGLSSATLLKSYLPEIMDIMLEFEKYDELSSLVNSLYPHNPKAVHDRLQSMFDRLEDLKENDRNMMTVTKLLQVVTLKHPEVFTQEHILAMFEMYKEGNSTCQHIILTILRTIGEKHPKNLIDVLPQLCDDRIFSPDSLDMRCGIIAGIGALKKELGQKVVDYLMKYIDYPEILVSQVVIGTLYSMQRDHVDYMQKYKPKLKDLEENSNLSVMRDMAHYMIMVLEGKSIEKVADGLEQQKESHAKLDTKVDATIDTMVTMGDKIIEHDKEIGELETGMEKIEERVEDVEEDVGETKLKVEEIDNKTMTNAPKWSRDLTKLMNSKAKNDWRLLASRLGYSNDDIRGWSTQHDPCMALLSEWYATHKTSEASFGVLTALTEMNRMDGAVIVENAMKQAEGVVEDEEFEYPSPPPIFLSYQWGFQNEVKLLKQHLNMAGYECWMDVGQMGGGDKLFAKIDNGIRGAKVVICCVTEKYAQSPNCNREVNLSVNLNKPIIPLLMEKMDWPPKGSMGPIFSEYLFIRFFQRGGEETREKDQRYWPIPKFQELLMQLNFFVMPDQKIVQKEYARWWAPMVEDIVIDKNKGKKVASSQKPKQSDLQVVKESPLVFLSYQWGKQPQVKALYQHLTTLGYSVWMDIYQMGGGDSLYDKIDRGIRGCKTVISCVTQKYTLSANCRREISLADALKKPIIPLLLEEMKWPPDGPMSMVFTELLYIRVKIDERVPMQWTGEPFDQLIGKLGQFIPEIDANAHDNKTEMQSSKTSGSKNKSSNNFAKDTRQSEDKQKRTAEDNGKEKNLEITGKTGSMSRDKRVTQGDKAQVRKSDVDGTAGLSAVKNSTSTNSIREKESRDTRVEKSTRGKTSTNEVLVNRTDDKTQSENKEKVDNKTKTVKTPISNSYQSQMEENNKTKTNTSETSGNVNKTVGTKQMNKISSNKEETRNDKSEAGGPKSKSCSIL